MACGSGPFGVQAHGGQGSTGQNHGTPANRPHPDASLAYQAAKARSVSRAAIPNPLYVLRRKVKARGAGLTASPFICAWRYSATCASARSGGPRRALHRRGRGGAAGPADPRATRPVAMAENAPRACPRPADDATPVYSAAPTGDGRRRRLSYCGARRRRQRRRYWRDWASAPWCWACSASPITTTGPANAAAFGNGGGPGFRLLRSAVPQGHSRVGGRGA